MQDSTPQPPTKQCTKCGETKPATTEYFYTREGRLRPECKQCTREQRREYYAANKGKRCEYQREYRTANKEKISENNREYRVANKEKISEKNRKYNAANAEKRREYLREYDREYLQTPRGKEVRRISHQRRRARKRALPATFTVQDWRRALDHFGYCCACCGEPLDGLFHQPAQDHWIPVTRGGAFTPDNIVPICNIRKGVSSAALGKPPCNQSKGNRDPHEWLVDRFGAKEAKRIEARIEAYFASLGGAE